MEEEEESEDPLGLDADGEDWRRKLKILSFCLTSRREEEPEPLTVLAEDVDDEPGRCLSGGHQRRVDPAVCSRCVPRTCLFVGFSPSVPRMCA